MLPILVVLLLSTLRVDSALQNDYKYPETLSMTTKMYVMTICIALIMISITSAAPKTLTSFSRRGKLKEAKTDKLLQLRGGGADWRYFVAGGGAAAHREALAACHRTGSH